jgi:hypothetical protein
VIPLLELSLHSSVPNPAPSSTSAEVPLKSLCAEDNSSYRRICQDLYAMLIWLTHEIHNEELSLKYLQEYNSPRPLDRQFLDTSHTHRQLPHLRAQSWWEESEVQLQFLSHIQSNYLLIKEEVMSLSASSAWGPYLDIRLSTNSNWDPFTSWDSIPLYGDDQWNPNHCPHLLPVTCSLLQQHHQEFSSIFNRSGYQELLGPSLLDQDYTEIPTLGIKLYKVWPHSRIKPHMGSPGRLVHSLGLVVPSNPRSTLTVGNVTKEWVEGQFHHFDDSYVHSVDNPNEKDIRIVLAFVATHPDLRQRKRKL